MWRKTEDDVIREVLGMVVRSKNGDGRLWDITQEDTRKDKAAGGQRHRSVARIVIMSRQFGISGRMRS